MSTLEREFEMNSINSMHSSQELSTPLAKKNNRGRKKSEGPDKKNYCIRIDEATNEKIREIGGGSLTQGVIKCLDAFASSRGDATVLGGVAQPASLLQPQ